MTPSAAQFLQKILQEYKGGKGVDGKGKGVDGKGLVNGKGLDGKGKGVVDGKVRQGRATKLFRDIRASKASRASSSMAVQKIVIWTPFKK